MLTARDPLEISHQQVTGLHPRIYATRRDHFISVTVDPRPGRTVHCPDLNACLINEHPLGEQIDCRSVHFGYAIPVHVLPLEERPDLAELILDPLYLSGQAVRYLLLHHPQLREEKFSEASMAATAKRDLRRKFSAESSGEEDIAAIAKQISDHAEAIYQTWKSRGLAPTEILNCHNNAAAADTFGSALSPSSGPMKRSSFEEGMDSPPELDNNNLEKLVNSFVEEDKARNAARQRSPAKNLPSSIQFALQKFERNSLQTQPISVKSLNSENIHKSQGQSIIQSPKLNHVNDASKEKEKSNNDSYSNATDSSSLNTWPLKNKLFSEVRGEKTVKLRQKSKYGLGTAKDNSLYLKEVAREEKRLIDALKTGALISDDCRDEIDSTLSKDSPDYSEPLSNLTNHTTPHPLIETKSPSKEDLSTMSLVDYAKIRYRAAQNLVQPKPKSGLNSTEQLVSITRTKFEPEMNIIPKEESKNERDFVPTRWGTKISSSRSRLEQVPHPELTVQQKQHIRSAGTAGSGNNPVRPFLTRGSVAERVLIFEKCPSELLLDKRGPRQPVINTWRGNHEVHSKAQVSWRNRDLGSIQVLPNTVLRNLNLFFTNTTLVNHSWNNW